jgi:hypothetical protein
MVCYYMKHRKSPDNPPADALHITILWNDFREISIIADKTKMRIKLKAIDNAVFNLLLNMFLYRRLLNFRGRCSLN